LKQRSENEVLQDMLQQAKTNGLLNITDEDIQAILNGDITSNQYILDLATHAYVISQLENQQNEILTKIDVNKATGEDLDTIGNLVGVVRSIAQPAMVDITIYSPTPAERDINIPQGTPIILEDVYALNNVQYVLSEDVTINEGVSSVDTTAQNTEYGYTTRLLPESVIGIEGFDTLSATNILEGTTGSNIEDDEDYRARIKTWNMALNKGTKASFDNYLANVTGLNDYRILSPPITSWGYVDVICDCLQSQLESIEQGIQENCMLVTDYPVTCRLPENIEIANLNIVVYPAMDTNRMTNVELTELIIQQCNVFVSGGTRRNGEPRKGLKIGEDFIPSQLNKYLLDEIPEVNGLQISYTSDVDSEELDPQIDSVIFQVPSDKKLKINEITVEYV